MFAKRTRGGEAYWQQSISKIICILFLQVCLWDLRQGRLLHTFRAHEHAVAELQ